MIDIKELRKDKRPQSSTVVHALLDRLEAWEAVFGHLGTPDEVGNEWRALSDRLEAAESECLEEARLNGMGSEREAALMAKLEAAEKSDAESLAMYRKARDERDALRKALEKIADWNSAWGPYPETNAAWRAMAIVTAREAVPRPGEKK